jgi:hypothetical protein
VSDTLFEPAHRPAALIHERQVSTAEVLDVLQPWGSPAPAADASRAEELTMDALHGMQSVVAANGQGRWRGSWPIAVRRAAFRALRAMGSVFASPEVSWWFGLPPQSHWPPMARRRAMSAGRPRRRGEAS